MSIPAEWLPPPGYGQPTPALATPLPAGTPRPVVINTSDPALSELVDRKLGALYTLIKPEWEDGKLGPGSIYRSDTDGTTFTRSQLAERQARTMIMAILERKKAAGGEP